MKPFTPFFSPAFFCSLLLSSTLLISAVTQAQVRAFVDRQQIQSYETVQLQVEIDERTNDEPDFSLLKKDFEVSQTRQSSSVRIVNGQMSATSQWTVALQPKHAGTLTIPSFSLSGQQTVPLKLEVLDQINNSASTTNDTHATTDNPAENSTQSAIQQKMRNQPDVFVVLEVSNATPYVQEPVLATLKIYHSVNIIQGGLSDWSPSNARVQRIPNQTETNDTVDGKPYQITQVHYWITPQQSGTLQLPSIVFQGEIQNDMTNLSTENLLSQFGAFSGKRISDATPPQTLQVRPQPASYPANTPWLPAKRIELQDSWTPNSKEVQVGQAITRNLNVQITGQWASLIPEIHYPAQNTLKFYPDQSQPQDQVTMQAVSGSKTLSIAMVPTQPGTINLPTQTLTWWNTQTDQLEHTQIPAASLKISPAPGQSMPAEASQITNATAPTTTASTPTEALNNQLKDPNATPFWQWLAMGFGCLWLLTLLLIIWMWNRPRTQVGEDKTETKDRSITSLNTSTALGQLKNALDQHDLAAIERSLIHWGQAYFQNPQLLSLSDLQDQTQNASLNHLLQQLSAQRFNPQLNDRPQPHDTQPNNDNDLHALLPLLKKLSNNQPRNKSRRKEAPLPELYPKH